MRLQVSVGSQSRPLSIQVDDKKGDHSQNYDDMQTIDEQHEELLKYRVDDGE